MKPNSNWSRRKFSKAVISAQVLLASGSLSFVASCISEKTNKAVLTLNKNGEILLSTVMDLLIPANHSHASASMAGGLEYIINILEELPEIKPVFLEIVNRIEEMSSENHNIEFVNINKND